MASSAAPAVSEEVTSIIIDVGSRYIRAGYSGEDKPTVVMTSHVGILPNDRRLYGDLALLTPQENMEIIPILSSTGILDMGHFEGLLEYVVVNRMGGKWSEYPVLLIENPFWTKETREELIKLFFDKFEVPAFYLVKSAVVGAFSLGKHTGIVVDCGASGIRVAPVHDGFLIKAGLMQQTLLGGDSLTDQCQKMLQSLNVGEIHIPQQVAHKSIVELGQPAKMEPKMLKGITESFQTYHRNRVLDDFKESTVQVSEQPFQERSLAMRPPKFYEFPDGFNRNFNLERFRVGEVVFNPNQFRFPQIADGGSDANTTVCMGLAAMIDAAIKNCDPEMRVALGQTIILIGGGASLYGLSERLSEELGRLSYGRARVQMGPTTQERRFSAWIGASILSSLSSFQQLWLSKQEYKENGPGHMDRKSV